MALAQAYLDTTSRAARACVERAEGNPLFLEQLLHHADEMETEGVPGSVQSLVLARLDSLPPAEKTALQAASIFGQRFSLAALRFLLDDPDYDGQEPVRHYLLRPEGDDLLFSHALIQEGIYASLLRSRARNLHVKAAQWFADRDPTLRAQHLDRGRSPAAADAYIEAAAAQMESYRHAEALTLIDRALAIANTDQERCDAFRLKGKALHDQGKIPDSKTCYQEALALASEPGDRCRARIGIVAALRMLDRQQEGFEILDLAEEEGREAGALRELSELHHLRGNLHFSLGEIDACVEHHDKALALARKTGSAADEARALGGLGDSFFLRGRMQKAEEHYRRCVELARQQGLGRMEVANHMARSFALHMLDHRAWQQALEIGVEAVEMARRVNDQRSLSFALVAVGRNKLDRIDVGDANENYLEAAQIARRIQARRLEVFEGSRALLVYRRGDSVRATELIETAISVARETSPGWSGPAVLGHLALVCDDPEKGRSCLREGEEALARGAVGSEHFHFYAFAIDVSLREGEWDEAERYAAALEDYAGGDSWPYAELLVARGRSLAAYGRGDRDADLVARIDAMREECHACDLWAPCFETVLNP